MEIVHLVDVHLSGFFFYYLAVNKLIIDETQNIHFIAEHSDFIKYTLKKLD